LHVDVRRSDISVENNKLDRIYEETLRDQIYDNIAAFLWRGLEGG
jgi:hypothetical protein